MKKTRVWNESSIQNLHDLARFEFSAKEIANLLAIAKSLREADSNFKNDDVNDGKAFGFSCAKIDALRKILASHSGLGYFLAPNDERTPLYIFSVAKVHGVDMEKSYRKVATPVLV